MRRVIALLATAGAIGVIVFLFGRRAEKARDRTMPAAPSASVHMTVGDSPPDVPIADDVDTASR